MKTHPKRDKPVSSFSQKIFCDASFDDPLDPDPVEIRDLRDEICRALDTYFALGGVGLVGDLALADHVNPPRAARGFDAERARKDLARCRKVTVQPFVLFPAKKPALAAKGKPALKPESLTGVELIAERTQTQLKGEFIREQARGARQKAERRAKEGKEYNADLIVTMCLRWGLLAHLGEAQISSAPDFFGPLWKAAVVPVPMHEWSSLLGGLRCVKEKAPPDKDQAKAVSALREATAVNPLKALEILAPWFGTTYNASA